MFLSADAEPFELFENVLPHAEAKGRTEDDLVSLCMQVPKCCAYMPSSNRASSASGLLFMHSVKCSTIRNHVSDVLFWYANS